MQRLEFHQGDSSTSDASETIWLVSGTGDGPRLAQALLERGWTLLVSVVSEAALPKRQAEYGSPSGPVAASLANRSAVAMPRGPGGFHVRGSSSAKRFKSS